MTDFTRAYITEIKRIVALADQQRLKQQTQLQSAKPPPPQLRRTPLDLRSIFVKEPKMAVAYRSMCIKNQNLRYQLRVTLLRRNNPLVRSVRARPLPEFENAESTTASEIDWNAEIQVADSQT